MSFVTDTQAPAVLFPGQGSQAVGIGKALAESSAAAREVFQEAGRLARSASQRIAGAHVVLAAAGLERGTLPRALDRLGVDRRQLADGARDELAVR